MCPSRSHSREKSKKALEEQRDLKGMSRSYRNGHRLPTENVSEVKNGQQKIVEKKPLARILLVKMTLNDDSWQYVKNTARRHRISGRR